MNLTELKKKPIAELVKIAEEMGLENMARNRKQDVIFRHSESACPQRRRHLTAMACWKFFPMAFGFLRSSEGSFLAGPDDIYVSPSADSTL
jgi:transcription termination factor Rho